METGTLGSKLIILVLVSLAWISMETIGMAEVRSIAKSIRVTAQKQNNINAKLSWSEIVRQAPENIAQEVLYYEAKIKSYLEAGGDPNAKDDNGNTPLKYALWIDNKELIELTIAKGADVNEKDVYDETILYYAVSIGNPEIINLLLDRGVDINSKNYNGETVLYFITKGGDLEIIKLLLDRGADINLKTNDGNTLLHAAAEHYDRLLVEFIIALGIDINIKNNDGKTPLDIAQENDLSEIVQLFQERGAVSGNGRSGKKSEKQ